jgi:hypothetical protein
VAKFKKGDAKPAASGRKKHSFADAGLAVKQEAERYSKRAIKEVARMLKESKDDGIKIQCCKLILERGIGRPKESEEPAPKEPPMSLEQIRQQIDELTKARQDSGPKLLTAEGISEKSKPVCEPATKAKPTPKAQPKEQPPAAEKPKDTQEEREVLDDNRWRMPSFLGVHRTSLGEE